MTIAPAGSMLPPMTEADRAFTDAVEYDGTVVRSDKQVTARGPGYRVQSNGMLAQADGSAVQLTQGVTGQLQMEASR